MKTHLSKHLWLLLWLLFAGSTIPSITWGYDAQPGHLGTGYGLHPALATDYDSAVVPTIGRETSPTAEVSGLFANSADFLAAEGGQATFNIARTTDGIITVAHPENADAFIMGQVSGGNLNILNVNVPGAMTGQGLSTQLYQTLVNEAGSGIQSITGELSGANKVIMQGYISEGYTVQAAASMTPAAAARTSAGFGVQSFDPKGVGKKTDTSSVNSDDRPLYGVPHKYGRFMRCWTLSRRWQNPLEFEYPPARLMSVKRSVSLAPGNLRFSTGRR